VGRTSFDLPAVPGSGTATVPPAGPVGPAAHPPWAGTKPLAVPDQGDFADLLPPVRYQPAATPARPSQSASARSRAERAAAPPPARSLLVLATMLGLVAVSVLYPIAGVAAALGGLVLLRATDLTAGRLGRRRASQGPRPSDAVSAAMFYPWAIVRAVLRFTVLAPLALMCATAAVVLAVVAAGPAQLPRAVSYAAGALVACYCLGPGSAACRRPLNRFYGRITRSAPAAVLGTVGVAAIAVAVAGAALTLAPGYWPAAHLGQQLQTVGTTHPTFSTVADVSRHLWHWLGSRIP
jgi:hypothetical protein